MSRTSVRQLRILAKIDAIKQEQESRLDCQGFCRDCGNGTLNNKLREAFDYTGNSVYCLNCGSTHVDIITI